MSKTMFEIGVGYDIGDAETGPLVKDCKDFYECEVNIFQPMENIFEDVRKKYLEEYQNDEMIGVHVVRLVPVDEAEKLRKELYDFDEEGYNLCWGVQ